jgi:maltose phosphorylase
MKMNQDYIKPDWSIIEEGFDASKSLSFSGEWKPLRANFEIIQAFSYIAGIYYPDKTKVGWWKNGYPVFCQSFKCSKLDWNRY